MRGVLTAVLGLADYGTTGQLGLEKTPDAYVATMVEVFREVRRVLRKDGTLWLNLGDSSTRLQRGANPGGFQGAQMRKNKAYDKAQSRERIKGTQLPGLKTKDLVGIPWRVAFALQADGWWLRQDIIWFKPIRCRSPLPTAAPKATNTFSC